MAEAADKSKESEILQVDEGSPDHIFWADALQRVCKRMRERYRMSPEAEFTRIKLLTMAESIARERLFVAEGQPGIEVLEEIELEPEREPGDEC